MPEGSLTAALTFLPQWWQEGADFDATLAGWCRACGCKAAGFIGAHDGGTIAKSTNHAAIERVELNDVYSRLRAGEPTVVVSTPGNTSRVYAPVACPGRPLAVLWIEQTANQAWSEIDLAVIVLTARSLERSPLIATILGPVLNAEQTSQRLADIGLLAGRMAHDFDNILTGILGFTDLTLPMLTPGTQPASYLDEIMKVGRRGIEFTQQMHAFNRAAEPKPTPGSVTATLGREEARLKSGLPIGVKIEKELPVNLPAVAIDAAPLQAALGHLFENAVQACGKAGNVKVTARLADLSEVESRSFFGKVAPGAHVVVTFADSGPGIKPEVRKKLFAEPFFTTKPRHRGLGLATAWRILTAHRGGLIIETIPASGTGTIVRAALPMAVSRVSVSVPTPPPVNSGLRNESALTVNSATTVRG